MLDGNGLDSRSASGTFGSTGPHGHRARMRTRLLAGPTALADYEILEMLLFFGVSRRDTKPQAKSLINQFGSLAGVLAAGRSELSEAGLPGWAAEAFSLVTEAAQNLSLAEPVERVTLGTMDALERYLDVPSRTRQPAGLAALLLNNRNQLLAECDLGKGDAAAVTKTVLRQALDWHATAVILVRNRGEAAATVTEADRRLFAHLHRAAAALSVVIHDVVVLGRGKWSSLSRGRGPL